MNKLQITLDRDITSTDKPIDLNIGIEQLTDFIDLYFSSIEIYLKAQTDGSINLSDLYLLGPFSLTLIEALTGADTILSEAKDLNNDEIEVLLLIANNYQLGSNARKYKQILKMFLLSFQTFTVFTNWKCFAEILFAEKQKV